MTQLKTEASRGLSGNALKLIAAAAMVVDHVGLMFFPGDVGFRIIGRLAFPIFAFMIAEGCKYTASRLRYFLSVFLLGCLCQGVYYGVSRSLYMNVLLTFSLGIGVTWALQAFRSAVFHREAPLWKKCLTGLVASGSVLAVWQLNRVLTMDYGFWGCMLPVFAGLFRRRRETQPDPLVFLDRSPVHVLTLGVGLVLLALDRGGVQMYSLLALPLLLLYSGQRGVWRLKYFFYIFYPGHLAVLEGLRILLKNF